MNYLRDVVLTLGGADASQFSKARDHLAKSPQQVRIIWNEGQNISGLYNCNNPHGKVECSRALTPFHRIWTPMHSRMNDDSRMMTFIAVSPSTRATPSANR